jgi:hypothetical protein
MFRKLTFLALLGGAVAFLLKKRSGQDAQPMTSTSHTQPPDVQVNEQDASAAQPGDQPEPQAAEEAADDLAEVRSGQTQDTVETPAVDPDGEQAAIPDVSDEDPLVREQEAAAAEDAGAIGGDADTVTAEAPEEMRPVVEGAGDAPETFETTDEQGR